MISKYFPTRKNKSPNSSLGAELPGGALGWARSRLRFMLRSQPAPLAQVARVHGLPLLSPRWLGELPTSLSGSTGSVYCLRDATWLFLRAELRTGIYDSGSDSGKQNVCQGKCSEHFDSQPDGLRTERVRVNKWDEALSPALQKPSLPSCQVVVSDSKK